MTCFSGGYAAGHVNLKEIDAKHNNEPNECPVWLRLFPQLPGARVRFFSVRWVDAVNTLARNVNCLNIKLVSQCATVPPSFAHSFVFSMKWLWFVLRTQSEKAGCCDLLFHFLLPRLNDVLEELRGCGGACAGQPRRWLPVQIAAWMQCCVKTDWSEVVAPAASCTKRHCWIRGEMSAWHSSVVKQT